MTCKVQREVSEKSPAPVSPSRNKKCLSQFSSTKANVSPAGFEPATARLEVRCSIP
jgi:hypothetical protein